MPPSEAEIEAGARALYIAFHGPDPDFPIGVDRHGYHQEPYVATVPGWKWFFESRSKIVLEAADRVRTQEDGR